MEKRELYIIDAGALNYPTIFLQEENNEYKQKTQRKEEGK